MIRLKGGRFEHVPDGLGRSAHVFEEAAGGEPVVAHRVRDVVADTVEAHECQKAGLELVLPGRGRGRGDDGGGLEGRHGDEERDKLLEELVLVEEDEPEVQADPATSSWKV